VSGRNPPRDPRKAVKTITLGNGTEAVIEQGVVTLWSCQGHVCLSLSRESLQRIYEAVKREEEG
jgi:hypothetical protein